MAIKDGWNQSEAAVAEYVIEIPVVHTIGDVNHDGKVNIKDVTVLIDYLLDNTTEVCSTCADVKSDGSINIGDVTELISILLTGNITSETYLVADLNEDGEIKISDVTELISLILSM